LYNILTIRLLFAPSFALDLGRVSDPQLQLQFCQQSFEPACVTTGFHPHTHLLPRNRQSTIEPLRLFAMLQPLFLELPSIYINPGDLLKLGMEISS
jgi:hypothetical protein